MILQINGLGGEAGNREWGIGNRKGVCFGSYLYFSEWGGMNMQMNLRVEDVWFVFVRMR